jgi:two-component system chemotaxis sensor kinase CheA
MELDHALLMQTFFAEAEEQLTAMEEGMVGIEHRPDEPDLLDTVFRAAHTLKGNAAVVGFHAIAERANHVEDVLDALRNGQKTVTAELVSSVLSSLDAMRSALTTAMANETSAAQALLVQDRATTLRIDAGKLDRMLSLSGEISIARGRLRTQLLAAGAAGEQALESHVEAERLYRELQDEIMRARLVPLGPIFRQYQRVARDLAIEHGKRAELVIEGEDVEIDTTLGEQIRGPIMHMLRNAIDHGIEAPDQRTAHGKAVIGRITLTAKREASHIVIGISDDGAGFSRSRIAERAALSSDGASGLSDDDLLEHVFEPGFSTADEVTSLSGRGVGMDVVKRNIEALRGTVSIASIEGAGSTITLRLPLTLAIIEGFFVEVGKETFVIPLEAVTECQTLAFEDMPHANGCGVLSFRGKPLPFVRLRDLFELGAARSGEHEHVAIVRCGERHAGIAVDALLGQDQAVIKPLGRLFRDVPGVAGSTIGGDGRVALILDVPALVALAQDRPQGPKELV